MCFGVIYSSPGLIRLLMPGVRRVFTPVSAFTTVDECRRVERTPKFKGKVNEKARDDTATLSLHMEEQCHT